MSILAGILVQTTCALLVTTMVWEGLEREGQLLVLDTLQLLAMAPTDTLGESHNSSV